MDIGPPVPGTLVLASSYQYLGLVGPFDYYRCVSCNSEYPAKYPEVHSVFTPLIERPHPDIRCNGHSIKLCPWCRVDSKPWSAGRGV